MAADEELPVCLCEVCVCVEGGGFGPVGGASPADASLTSLLSCVRPRRWAWFRFRLSLVKVLFVSSRVPWAGPSATGRNWVCLPLSWAVKSEARVGGTRGGEKGPRCTPHQ